MPTAIGYIRVSTEGQAVEGVSMDAQRAKIESWCKLNDYTLIAVHVDAGISGKSADNRPGLQAALDQCKKGTALVVYSLSRLARSTRDTIDISDRLISVGADLVSLSEKIDTTSASGKMIFRLLAVMAEFERDLISERTTVALQHKRANGERTGGLTLGYKVGDDGKKLVEVEDEQRAITRARELRDSGLSLRKIAAHLQGEGLVSRKGTTFQVAQIQRMVGELSC